MTKENTITGKFNYAWIIIALCFLMVFTCLGFVSSNRSLYLTSITSALNIKRSVFSISDSLRFISTAIINIFFGTLISKFGTKKLIGAGFIALIASVLIQAYATNILAFYFAGILLGIGFSWTTTTMVGCVVNKWCKENRGTIMGAILASNGLGGALAAQIVTPIIKQKSNPFGYRQAYLLVASILLIVGILIVIFFKENPPGEKNSNAIVHKKKGRGQTWVGITFKEAVKRPYFYISAVCIFCTGMVLQGISGIAAAHLEDVGLDAGFIATVLSIHSLALAGFKFLTGFLYDKFGLRVTMTICDIAAVVVMLSLSVVSNSSTGAILAVIYGVFSSLALPLETIMLPIFASDLFGEREFNKIMGIFVSINVAGYAVGIPIMNVIFDVMGTYIPALIGSAILMTAVTVLFQFALTSANKVKAEIVSIEEMKE